MAKSSAIDVVAKLDPRILSIRGHRVMLDADLAEVYRTTTGARNQAVKRNRKRFPAEFMFRLTFREKEEVVTNCDHLRKLKYSPSLPFAFTEYGGVMLAAVLNSSIAVQASIAVVRAFIRLRVVLATHKELARKLALLEKRIEAHDEEIVALFNAIRDLMKPSAKLPKRIGFQG